MGDLEDTLNKVRRDFIRPKPDLVINKVPTETLDSFKSLADTSFAGDYGFTLKWLLDFYLPKNFELEKRVEMLESVIGNFINKDSKKEDKTIKLANGKTVTI